MTGHDRIAAEGAAHQHADSRDGNTAGKVGDSGHQRRQQKRARCGRSVTGQGCAHRTGPVPAEKPPCVQRGKSHRAGARPPCVPTRYPACLPARRLRSGLHKAAIAGIRGGASGVTGHRGCGLVYARRRPRWPPLRRIRRRSWLGAGGRCWLVRRCPRNLGRRSQLGATRATETSVTCGGGSALNAERRG